MKPQSIELEREWVEFSSRKESWASAAETLEYQNIFSRGYIFSKGYPEEAAPRHWFTVRIGQWKLAFDPRQPVTIQHSNQRDHHVIVLGHVFDSVSGRVDADGIAKGLMSKLPETNGSWDDFDEEIIHFGGRYVVMGITNDEVRVHVDPMATKSCYWHAKADGKTVLASHSALLAESIGDESALEVKWIMNHPEYINPGGKTLPGLIQPHDNANMIFPNCALRVSDGRVEHERVFPRGPLKEMSLAAASSQFIEELRFQIWAWSQVSEKHILTLTAGRDSRTLLSCGLDLYRKIDTTALSYHFFERNSKTTLEDIIGANRLAHLTGLPHIIRDVRPMEARTPMAELYLRTFPTWARFPTLASTFYETLPSNATLTLGIGGEIGTAFYREREEKQITPELLAAKFAFSKVKVDPTLLNEMRKYIEFTQFDQDRLFNYDFYDLFYWEHRLGKWAAVGYSEYDLSAIPAIPMNSRRLLTAMLSLPYEDQASKEIYEVVQDVSGIRL